MIAFIDGFLSGKLQEWFLRKFAGMVSSRKLTMLVRLSLERCERGENKKK